MKEVVRYQCEFCGKDFRTPNKHQCKYDPSLKNCYTCKHCEGWVKEDLIGGVDVRVERLNDISEEQAKKEGIRGYTKDGTLFKYALSDKDMQKITWSEAPKSAIERFKMLWNSTVKKSDLDHYGWDANPWVWVIEFEKVEVI